jgi:predicted HAD superfamily Cof-like phosphohydrolase
MVRAFHQAFDLVIRDAPDADPVTDEEVDLRMALILEEVEELAQAMTDGDVVEVADALADIVYVIYGTALHYGIDLDAVVAEVHRSNMSKLGADGKPLKRLDGKVLKPDTYFPPNVAAILGVSGNGQLSEEAAEAEPQRPSPESEGGCL